MADVIQISDAAKQIGVSHKTLLRWDKSGKLTALRNALDHRVYTLEMLAPFLPKLPEKTNAN